ncbi:hypothetical protein GCM10011344_02610 [Dokdonia pacifica]|uniref:Uncharacterized protein n=1 Tax=Dokdonia pacifica TaxID=1627892 RepID=A0A238ZDT9_9FLAO|nr:hypothetical protein [Dokdonia pacifica]GGG05605.1 hypothetical protein GCM10011344_02610 [Dokdonia pacifica]SNR81101.1 hypothetical protein SAMN06265376_103122 [Dokdonia pacifica]
MKRTIVLALVLFLGTLSVGAQNLGNIQRGQRGYSPPPRQLDAGEPEKPDVNKMSIEKATLYKELLGIDVFEKEVLRTYLKDYYRARVDIDYNPDLKFEDKQKQINIEQKKFEKALKEVFTEDQIEQILIEEQFGNRAEEKKKEAKEAKKKKRNKKNKKG